MGEEMPKPKRGGGFWSHDDLPSQPELKSYILFFADRYYPQGGMNDIHSSYDTIEEGVALMEKIIGFECYGNPGLQLVEKATWKVVALAECEKWWNGRNYSVPAKIVMA